MPFPLAHPAAVLPLRRYCPRYLSFAALVIGSMVPDTGYLLDDWGRFPDAMTRLFGPAARHLELVRLDADWDDMSHVFMGSLFYCLPVGLFILYLVSWLRTSLVATLPNPHRDALLPLCQASPVGFIVSVASLLVGTWSHIAWDQLTSSDRWLAHHYDFPHWPVAHLGTRQIELYQLLWLISTLGGMLILGFAYARFLLRQKPSSRFVFQAEMKPLLLWSAILLIPAFVAFPLTSHFENLKVTWGGLFSFAHRFAGLYLSLFCCFAFVLSLVAKSRTLGTHAE